MGELRPGYARIDVHACGICGNDLTSKHPGHEIAGVVRDTGQRVLVGWFGGSCGHCRYCVAGDPVHCADRLITGDGFAQVIDAPLDTLVPIPDELSFADAAPFGCAGVTTFRALEESGLKPGAQVAIFGLGGLGHLAAQFAHAMGLEVTVLARGTQRAADAASFGAAYIDTEAEDVAETRAGAFDLIVSTVPNAAAVARLVGVLAPHGQLVVIGVDSGSLEIPMGQLVAQEIIVRGHLTGSPADTARALAFAVQHGITPRVERLPLESVQEGFDRLKAGQARYRIVVENDHA